MRSCLRIIYFVLCFTAVCQKTAAFLKFWTNNWEGLLGDIGERGGGEVPALKPFRKVVRGVKLGPTHEKSVRAPHFVSWHQLRGRRSRGGRVRQKQVGDTLSTYPSNHRHSFLSGQKMLKRLNYGMTESSSVLQFLLLSLGPPQKKDPHTTPSVGLCLSPW